MAAHFREDFVHVYKETMKLSEVIDYIERKEKILKNHPVVVFKVDPAELKINLDKYIKKTKNLEVHVEELVEDQNGDGLFSLDFLDIIKRNQRKLLENKEQYLIRNKNESDNEFGLRIFQKVVSDAGDPDYKLYYARDSTCKPVEGKTFLDFKNSKFGKDVNVQGVNTSMFYTSIGGSLTTWHSEDGDQPSVNVLLEGDTKVFGFIPKEYAVHLSRLISEEIGEACDKILFHKPGWFIDPAKLYENDIPIQFFVQKPGMLLFINEAVLHSAVSVGRCCAEAINLATFYSISRKILTMCECEDVGRMKRGELVEPEETIIESQKPKFICQNEECVLGMAFWSRKEFLKHCQSTHGDRFFKCDQCEESFEFATMKSLKRHILEKHLGAEVPHSECPECKISIRADNLQRHIKEKHTSERNEICRVCKSSFTARHMKIHEANCEGKVHCLPCNKIFTTIGYYKQHMKHKHGMK